ncbi:MAG: hypothetical protein GY838_17280 [bacterium]|nr:hypothetical protein [bacterium]
MTKPVVILGGLGNGSVVAAAIREAATRGVEDYEVAGYLNDREEPGAMIEDDKVLGPVSEAPALARKGYRIINTIYRIDGQDARIKLFEDLDLPDSSLATFIHPTVYLPGNVEVGPGSVLMPGVVVSPGAKFGRCNLVMLGATIGHNTHIGDHCHFAAQCCVGAYLKIEEGAHVGLNATIREEVTLGQGSTLGMASVLLKSIPPYEIWAGSPAKKIRDAQRELA